MKWNLIKGIISYVIALMLAVVFGLFLDANVGWFILLTLIMAPLISVFLAWISSHTLEVACHMEEALLSKGDKCSMEIVIRNKSIFPTPPMEVLLTQSAGAKYEGDKWLVSVMSRNSQSLSAVFVAKICGKSQVGVESILVTDYLGLFTFRAKSVDYDSLKKNISVIPDTADIGPKDEAVIKVMQTSLHMDDSDDTVDGGQFAFGGFPGYDNREYVPGDPLKRINWKQSAKRDKLLVRLDDEMAAHSVNVVLDSVFDVTHFNMYEIAPLVQYRDLEQQEIIPTIAQEAVENALGITQVLVRQNYTVNFYAVIDGHFVKYEVADDVDLEHVRVELASYEFSVKQDVPRLPLTDADFKDRVGIFSTPNEYSDAEAVLDAESNSFYTTVYSAVEEAKKLGTEGGMHLQPESKKPQTESGDRQKLVATLSSLVIPYFLSLFLSTVVFSTFDIEIFSWWTLAQMLVCAGIMVLCEFVREHKLAGTVVLVVLVSVLLYVWTAIMYSIGYINYIKWFISAGDAVETTTASLFTLLIIFTVFFGLVVYYFTKISYRTSYLLLTSMIPLILYVKVMKPVNMTQVVFITVFNVAAFLVHLRTGRDKDKKIIGYISGLVSYGLYAVLFIMTGLWLPEAETKYYYVFEEAFLGGNATEPIPGEYSQLAQYSGNADDFNKMSNRKLFVVTGQAVSQPLYLKRQTFDVYNYNMDRWEPSYMYSRPFHDLEKWQKNNGLKQLGQLLNVLKDAKENHPEILEKYGINYIPETGEITPKNIWVQATNYANATYVTPPGTVDVYVDYQEGFIEVYVTYEDVFMPKKGLVGAIQQYNIRYYDEEDLRAQWLACGGANLNYDTALSLMNDLRWAYGDHAVYSSVIEQFLDEAYEAKIYKGECEDNVAKIPSRIKELAQEITKDCTYDWEKAKALQDYFETAGFTYDLSYDAPDDSVEYFLFEGKTGTCSDYATAYVLMARSVGLIARYVEGFVPKLEMSGEYVVRSNCGHAYPEVYIPGVGFVVYEATKPAVYREIEEDTTGAVEYFAYAGIRVLMVFGLVTAVIILILLICKVVAPMISERRFKKRVRKAGPRVALIIIYRRIQKMAEKSVIESPGNYTPYEYAKKYEELTAYDIGELTYMLENAVYQEHSESVPSIKKAMTIYAGTKAAVKGYRKNKKNSLKTQKRNSAGK